MELIKVGLRGYRRFRESQEMDVDAKLIAIVGPNEAGKSSLLEALERLNDENPYEHRERTRHVDDPETEVWARYILDGTDRAALVAVPEAQLARQLVVTKDDDGDIVGEVEGEIHRDQGLRHTTLSLVNRALGSRWLRDADKDEDNSLGASLSLAAQALASAKEDLDEGELQALRDLGVQLNGEDLPARLRRLPKLLGELIEYEEDENPRERAERILLRRRPEFVRFDSQSRELRPSYSFDEAPNAALNNFLALAGTSWGDVMSASADPGALKGLVDAADARLREVFSAWQQSSLTVSFQVAERTLHLLVRLAATSDYVAINERSDGLRQFIALRAFLHARGISGKPVLLIDEAESHLHYDGQADLIAVLGEQEEAVKVIYTTHSAGCLPLDLGTGVRIVLPVGEEDPRGRFMDRDESRIVNWFWTEEIEGQGFSSLLIGMGASTLAFASTRRALIGEGGSEAILLPTLLREANDLERLNFQVAPGLANVSREAVRELDLSASRVAYLVDGDKGGNDRRKLLIEAGVPADRILRLGSSTSGIVLEDLLVPEVYRTAVNEELRRWHGEIDFPAASVTKTGRPAALAKWCEKHGIKAPGKRAIAHRVIEKRRSERLVDPRRRKLLQRLHADLERLLARAMHEQVPTGSA